MFLFTLSLKPLGLLNAPNASVDGPYNPTSDSTSASIIGETSGVNRLTTIPGYHSFGSIEPAQRLSYTEMLTEHEKPPQIYPLRMLFSVPSLTSLSLSTSSLPSFSFSGCHKFRRLSTTSETVIDLTTPPPLHRSSVFPPVFTPDSAPTDIKPTSPMPDSLTTLTPAYPLPMHIP